MDNLDEAMIDPRRLKYVMDGMGFNVPDTTQRILELSDEWIAKQGGQVLMPWEILKAPTPSTQEKDMTDDDREPELPEGVRICGEHDYRLTQLDGSPCTMRIKPGGTAEIRAICDHADWRERQAGKQKVPEVSNDMVNSAISAFFTKQPNTFIHWGAMESAIAAALACRGQK